MSKYNNITDPAVRRTIARQLRCYRAMMRSGKHITQRRDKDRHWEATKTNLQKTFKRVLKELEAA